MEFSIAREVVYPIPHFVNHGKIIASFLYIVKGYILFKNEIKKVAGRFFNINTKQYCTRCASKAVQGKISCRYGEFLIVPYF